jgi:hypothetical protein
LVDNVVSNAKFSFSESNSSILLSIIHLLQRILFLAEKETIFLQFRQHLQIISFDFSVLFFFETFVAAYYLTSVCEKNLHLIESKIGKYKVLKFQHSYLINPLFFNKGFNSGFLPVKSLNA